MKNGGGHFAPELGGHFELESGAHFKLELGGQYHWNLHSREEAAKLLSISLVTLWDLTRKDKIPAFRIGNKVQYKKNDVLNALTQKNKFNGSR